MRVRIKDIAEKTGLSVSTVSLVLSKKEHRIPVETCKRVIDVAKELHYRPNQMAASLVTQRTKTIGLIIPDITNMFFAEIAKSAENECQKAGYSIILCNTNDNPQSDIDYVNMLVGRGVDGILFAMAVNATVNKAEECFAISHQYEKPIILVDRVVPGLNTVCVLSDNEMGGYVATRHLLELGHKKIGCITGPMGAQSSKQRLFGYIRALQEYGVAFDTNYIKEGNYHTQSGFQLSKELFELDVTAIFACNDMMAYGVYKQAAFNGKKIPEDLSIVGFDDLQFSELMEVPLTSVSQPAIEMGQSAVKRMIKWIDHPDQQPENITFKSELIIRKSTSMPAER